MVDAAGGIPYRVRVSRRARRLQIQITVHGEVEVVLPHGMPACVVPEFVARHQDWIARTRARQMAARPRQACEPALPHEIHFPAVGARWQVQYRWGCGSGLEESPSATGSGELVVLAGTEADARRRLQDWLGRQGRRHLTPWLQAVAGELGMHYQRVSIRAQRSRWGSYSARGTVSLNRALLFLEPELVRHLFVHELCHSVHLNHSPRFWALVRRFSPDYRRLEQALDRAVPTIPRWAMP